VHDCVLATCIVHSNCLLWLHQHQHQGHGMQAHTWRPAILSGTVGTPQGLSLQSGACIERAMDHQ